MGILSMQRVLNYGSFLQAYALKQLLLQNGADDVYFIDIEKGRSLAGFEQENSLLKKLFRAIVLLVQGQLPAKIRDMKFMVKLAKSLKSQWPELSLDEINPNHFDVVFIGSDEVFNCCQKQLVDIRRNSMGIFHRRIGLYHTQAHLDILH